ncbi:MULTISPECIES: hypothetical protein [Actinomycetes]|uniref:hypothetical protein n=1 Tax=Actinomycetes TaxID=1760 RepID=UPI0004C1101D|nr:MULTISPECIES: hypothetical protein [Actinomycetes]
MFAATVISVPARVGAPLRTQTSADRYNDLDDATAAVDRNLHRDVDWSPIFAHLDDYRFGYLTPTPATRERIIAIHPATATEADIVDALARARHNAIVVSLGLMTVQTTTLPNQENAI